MKIPILAQKRNVGGTLLTTLVIAAVVGMTLMAYLKMVSNQNYFVQRSQTWNATVPIIEAGLEEALTHLNRNGTNVGNPNLTADGWILRDGVYVKQSWVGENYYTVNRFSGLLPCAGQLRFRRRTDFRHAGSERGAHPKLLVPYRESNGHA
jgi:hypothetical protein